MFLKSLVSLSFIFLVACTAFSQRHDIEKSVSFNLRAGYFFKQKLYDSALYEIEQSLRYDPKNWGAYNNRAILRFRTGQAEEQVVKDFRKALEIKPNYEISLYSLANYYMAFIRNDVLKHYSIDVTQSNHNYKDKIKSATKAKWRRA